MYKKKYHIISGVVCLAINIVLPTFIYHYYLELKRAGEIMFYSPAYHEIAGYSLLVILSFLWFASMVIALRELGGYVLQLGSDDYVEKYQL